MKILSSLLLISILATKLMANPLEKKSHIDFLDYAIDFSNETIEVDWVTKYISESNGKLTIKKFDASSTFLRGMFLFSLLRVTNQKISASSCENSVCFQYDLLSWTEEDVKSVDASAKIYAGKSLVQKIELLPNGFFVHYDAAGISALFNKLYKKPTEKYKGQILQMVYDAFLKEWFADHYSFAKEIMASPDKFKRLKFEYFEKARTDPNFSGTQETFRIIPEYGCATYTGLQWVQGKKCDERWFGTLIRRSEDGTLPLVLRLMEKVLQDYDPNFYQQVMVVPINSAK